MFLQKMCNISDPYPVDDWSGSTKRRMSVHAAAGELLGSVLEQGAVAVTEEAEVVGEGVVVDLVPVVADECAD